ISSIKEIILVKGRTYKKSRMSLFFGNKKSKEPESVLWIFCRLIKAFVAVEMIAPIRVVQACFSHPGIFIGCVYEFVVSYVNAHMSNAFFIGVFEKYYIAFLRTIYHV